MLLVQQPSLGALPTSLWCWGSQVIPFGESEQLQTESPFSLRSAPLPRFPESLMALVVFPCSRVWSISSLFIPFTKSQLLCIQEQFFFLSYLPLHPIRSTYSGSTHYLPGPTAPHLAASVHPCTCSLCLPCAKALQCL